MSSDEESSGIILLVEDSDADAILIRRAMESSSSNAVIVHLKSADEALDYLTSQGDYSGEDVNNPLPSIILLDLNMPGTDGRTFLIRMKAVPALKRIPVIVLSTSDDQMDVNRSYDVGVNAYIQKPSNAQEIEKVIEILDEHWFKAVLLPETLS